MSEHNAWGIIEEDAPAEETSFANLNTIEYDTINEESFEVEPFDPGNQLIPANPHSALLYSTEELTMEQAEVLTEHIRSASTLLHALIARAHQGKAWKAMGYTSFEQYVKTEFAISRSRAYQLLNQSKFVEQIEAVLPPGTVIEINEATARDLKDLVHEIVPELEERTKSLSSDEASEVAKELLEEIREERERARQEATPQDEDHWENEGGYDGPYDPDRHPEPADEDFDDIDDLDDLDGLHKRVQSLYNFLQVKSLIDSLPEPKEMLEVIPKERHQEVDDSVDRMFDWVAGFREDWKNYRNNHTPSESHEVDGNDWE